MKKTQINLLSSRSDYQKYEQYFFFVRITTIVLSGIFFVILFFYIGIVVTQFRKISSFNSAKKALLEQLNKKDEEQANILLFNKKYAVFKEYLKEDAQSLPYYNLLSSAISTSSESGTLKSFLIAKNRQSSFTVAFQNFNELMSFFRFVESKTFLKNFEKVTLMSFNTMQNSKTSTQKDTYELSFDTVFIPIKK